MRGHLSIAILNWNGKLWLEKFLPTLIKFSRGAQIYVIDNCSTDDSLVFLNEYFHDIKIIQNKENLGFASGYNEGLKQVSGEFWCLLNSDVEVTENWLEPIMNLFAKDDKIVAIQPKVLDFNKKNYFEFAGAAGGLIDNLGYPYCRGRIFDSIEEDKGQYNDITEIFWASGCALFVRASAFKKVGGFDARFFAHQEEIDLCWRLKNLRQKVYYCGKSTVYHVGGGTLNKQSAFKTFLNFRNNLTMLLKNLPRKNVVWVIFLRLILDGSAAIYFGFKLGFSHFTAVIKAHFAFYKQAPVSIKLRNAHPIKNYYQSKWLIFKHFL